MWRRRRRKRRRKKASPPLGTTRLLKEEEEGLSVGVRSKGFFPFSPSFAQPRKRPSHFPLSLVFPLCPKTVTQVQERRRDVRRRGRRAVPHLAPPTTTVNSPRNFAAEKKQCEKSASVFLRSFEKVRRTLFLFPFQLFLAAAETLGGGGGGKRCGDADSRLPT